jgi:hypothetical protein
VSICKFYVLPFEQNLNEQINLTFKNTNDSKEIQYQNEKKYNKRERTKETKQREREKKRFGPPIICSPSPENKHFFHCILFTTSLIS